MKQFIKVCESRYGASTCIYHYINTNQIVELHIEKSQYEINVEATLTNGMKVIIIYKDDIVFLVGVENWEEISQEIEEIKERYANKD